MEKKGLIVCQHFAPNNSVASIRTTKMAKYLSLSGYRLDILIIGEEIVLIDPILQYDLNNIEGINLIKVHNCKFIKSILKKRAHSSQTINITKIRVSLFKKFIKKIKKHLTFAFFLVSQFDVYRRFKRMNFKSSEYSFVFSTYSPFASHWIGSRLKKLNPKIKWIADFRDPVIQNSVPFIFRRYATSFASKYCHNADYITSVSSEQIIDLNIDKYKGKIVTIPNGFDLEDIEFIDKQSFDDGLFNIVYTGVIYKDKQDFSPLFRALSELSTERQIDLSLIKIHYAGNQFEIFKSFAEERNLQENLINHGFISREKSLNLQAKSNVRIFVAWKNDIENMSLGGKLFEYFLLPIPIIAMVTGNRGQSELKEIIHKTNSGLCYEEFNKKDDFHKLKNYLYEIYCDSIFNNRVKVTRDETEINKYEYKNITCGLIDLIEN
jgi:glycosyltransferase involved in cell wall biosynthesis